LDLTLPVGPFPEVHSAMSGFSLLVKRGKMVSFGFCGNRARNLVECIEPQNIIGIGLSNQKAERLIVIEPR